MAAENIYDNLELQTLDDATCEDAEMKTRPTAKERDLQNILQSEIRRQRRIGLRVGLLCAVLVLLNIAVPLYLYQSNKVERDNYNQLQARNTNLTEDREQLQTNFNRLKTSFDQLQTRHNSPDEQKDQLQTNYNQLQNRHNQLTQQKDQLQTTYNQLQNRHNQLTQQKDQLQSSSDQLQTSFDQLQTRQNNLTKDRDDMKLRLCESPGWQKFDRGCYYISTGTKNWEESRQWCRDRQSDLIVIKSEAKQDFVASFNKRVWLGLTDRDREGSFQWIDGTPLTTPTYWVTGEPDLDTNMHPNEEEDCAEYYDGSHSSNSNKGWNDAKCSWFAYSICEIVLC